MTRSDRLSFHLISGFLILVAVLLLSTCVRPDRPAYANPEGCAVTGLVFSQGQTFALLHSNCVVEITRRDSVLIFTSPQSVVTVEIPANLPKTAFYYPWGSQFALFGTGHNAEGWKPVTIGARRGA